MSNGKIALMIWSLIFFIPSTTYMVGGTGYKLWKMNRDLIVPTIAGMYVGLFLAIGFLIWYFWDQYHRRDVIG